MTIRRPGFRRWNRPGELNIDIQNRLQGALQHAGTIGITLLGLLLMTFTIGRIMPADPVGAMIDSWGW